MGQSKSFYLSRHASEKQIDLNGRVQPAVHRQLVHHAISTFTCIYYTPNSQLHIVAWIIVMSVVRFTAMPDDITIRIPRFYKVRKTPITYIKKKRNNFLLPFFILSFLDQIFFINILSLITPLDTNSNNNDSRTLLTYCIGSFFFLLEKRQILKQQISLRQQEVEALCALIIIFTLFCGVKRSHT